MRSEEWLWRMNILMRYKATEHLDKDNPWCQREERARCFCGTESRSLWMACRERGESGGKRGGKGWLSADVLGHSNGPEFTAMESFAVSTEGVKLHLCCLVWFHSLSNYLLGDYVRIGAFWADLNFVTPGSRGFRLLLFLLGHWVSHSVMHPKGSDSLPLLPNWGM